MDYKPFEVVKLKHGFSVVKKNEMKNTIFKMGLYFPNKFQAENECDLYNSIFRTGALTFRDLVSKI